MLLFIRSFIIISLCSCFVKNFLNYFLLWIFQIRSNFYIISSSKPFVKNFFSNVMMYVLIVLRQQLLHLTTFRHCLSRTFFQILFSMLLYFVLPHRQRSIYYHYFQPVSTLFLCFFNSSAICSLTLKTLVYFSLLYGKKQIITKRHLASG